MGKTALPGSGGTGDVAGGVLHASDIDKLPGGWLDYVEITTATTAAATGSVDFTSAGLTITPTVNASRKIKVTGFARFGSDHAGDDFQLGIFESTTHLSNNSTNAATTVTNANYGIQTEVILTPSTGAHTYFLRGGLYNGTGHGTLLAGATSTAWLLCEDIGPA